MVIAREPSCDASGLGRMIHRDALSILSAQTLPAFTRKHRVGKRWPAILVTMAFSALGVVGDYFLKLGSESNRPLRSRWFYIGFAVYASTAFGWVFVMRHLKLATIGVIYSVSMILLLTGVGTIAFREPLNSYEIVGILLAIGALFLLVRFA
jgi:drug/metabolite transporter (DMT)-like permease